MKVKRMYLHKVVLLLLIVLCAAGAANRIQPQRDGDLEPRQAYV